MIIQKGLISVPPPVRIFIGLPWISIRLTHMLSNCTHSLTVG